MVRGSGRSLTPLLTALMLMVVACSNSGAAAPSTSEVEPATVTSSTSTTSTTTTTSTTSTTLPPTSTTTTTTAPLPEIDAEVLIPEGTGPFPAVVLVHGGGWVAGDSSSMKPLAEFLTDEGFLTVNTNYTLSGEEPGFPAAVDDVACAVRYAAALPDSDGTVVVLGHSAGAHLGAVVALNGDDYGGSCPIPGSGIPDRLVGLAGPYDVDRLGSPDVSVLRSRARRRPGSVARRATRSIWSTRTRISTAFSCTGTKTGWLTLPSHSTSLMPSPVPVRKPSSKGVEGAQHNDMFLPRFVGDLVATWLER